MMSRKAFSFFTGGKDSTAAHLMARRVGIDPELLVTIRPLNRESYMFHSVNLWVTTIQAALLRRRQIFYTVSGRREEEVDELRPLVEKLYEAGYEVATVGGLLSNYQKRRFERLLGEYGVELFSPFWGVEQEEILHRYIGLGIMFMLTSVSALGLGEEHLGWVVRDEEDVERLVELAQRYGFNPTGEGGEYESLVLYAEGFSHVIRPTRIVKHWDGYTGYVEIHGIRLERAVERRGGLEVVSRG